MRSSIWCGFAAVLQLARFAATATPPSPFANPAGSGVRGAEQKFSCDFVQLRRGVSPCTGRGSFDTRRTTAMTLDSLQARVLDADIRQLILRRAHRLCRRAGYRRCDLDDLVQELTLRLLERLDAFDPDRGSFYCFALVVLDRAAATAARSRAAACRDASTTVSFESPDPRANGSAAPVGQSISATDRENRLGRYSRTERELRELAIDVCGVLDELPAELRDVAEGLILNSRCELARRMGVDRKRVLKQALEVRIALFRAGLGSGDFTDRPAVPSGSSLMGKFASDAEGAA